ncbi:MAG: PqqD family protein [Clostridia bacterium]|nr:PqqD family protein [Clostridia bacterium]
MKNNDNYLEKVPKKAQHISWSVKDDKVTLEIENKGVFNRIAQVLFKKPKISYVHLDEMGSFLWPLIDGEKNLIDLGKYVEIQFGDKAQPLYPRLAKYFQILDSYKFISWNE